MRTNERASLELDGPCSDQGRLPSPASDGAQHSHSTTAVDSEATANGRGTVDAALAEAGTGRFQWFALHVFGLANAADAMEILSVSLVLPAAEDDLGLTAHGTAALTTSIFVGMLMGGVLWGLFGDNLGRRRPLAGALVLSGVFGLLSSQARSLGGLAFCRMVAGIGVGGTVPTAFTYMSEAVEPSMRGRFVVGVASHWMLGSILSALLGWIIIPAAGWHTFLAVVALPSLVGAVEALWLPESPHYLAASGQREASLAVLRSIAAINRRGLTGSLTLAAAPGSAGQAPGSGDTSGDDRGRGGDGGAGGGALRPGRCRRRGAEGVALVWHQLQALLGGELRRTTLLLALVWWALSAGWYGLLLWFPEFMKRRGAEPVQVYFEMLLVALSTLPGNISSAFLVDRIGRRRTLGASMAGSAACITVFAALPVGGSKTATLIGLVAIMGFNCISVAGWNTLSVITPELYPTPLRCTAMGLMGACGRVGSIVGNTLSAWLLGLAAWAPLVAAAVSLTAGTLAVLSLPETAGRSMGGPESVVKSKAASSGAPVETHLPGPQAVQCSLDSLAEAEHMHLLRYGDHSA
eukprot:jgi/Tetstr1/441885/TSEL_030095.t1